MRSNPASSVSRTDHRPSKHPQHQQQSDKVVEGDCHHLPTRINAAPLLLLGSSSLILLNQSEIYLYCLHHCWNLLLNLMVKLLCTFNYRTNNTSHIELVNHNTIKVLHWLTSPLYQNQMISAGFGKQTIWYKYVRIPRTKVLESMFTKSKAKTQSNF
jgi:hypothetical protein